MAIDAQEPSDELVGSLSASEPSISDNGLDANEPSDIVVQSFADQQEFGNPITAALLGGARTLTFGGSDVALTKGGVFSPEDLRKYKEQSPVATTAGEVGAIGLSLIPTGGLVALSGASRLATTGIRGVSKVGSIVERAVAKKFADEVTKSGFRKALEASTAFGAGTAVEGAFYGAGQVVSEAALGNPEVTAENVLSTVGLSTLLSGVGGGVLNATGKAMTTLIKSTPQIAKKTFSAIRGIDEEVIDVVSKRGDEIAEFEALGNNFNDAKIQYTSKVAEDVVERRGSLFDSVDEAIEEGLTKAENANVKIPFNRYKQAIQKEIRSVTSDGVAISPQVQSTIKALKKLEDDLRNLAQINTNKKASDEVLDTLLKKVSTSGKTVRTVRRMKEDLGINDDFVASIKTALDEIGFNAEGDILRGLRTFDKFKKQGLSNIEARNALIKEAKWSQSINNRNIKAFKTDAERAAYSEKIAEPIIDESGEAFVFNLFGTDKAIPVELIGKKLDDSSLYLSPRQINTIRKQLNSQGEAAFNKLVGGNKPASQAYASLSNESRKLLDDYVSKDIRKENAKLAKLFKLQKELSRFGFRDFEISPKKLGNLLSSSEKAFEDVKPLVKQLDELLGTDLISKRELVNAAKQLDTKAQLFKFPTGLSTLVPGLGALAGSPFGVLPAAIAGLGGAVLQSPIATRPILRTAEKISSLGIGEKVLNTSSLLGKVIPEEMMPFVAAQISVLSQLQQENEKVNRRIESSVSKILKGESLNRKYLPKKSGILKFSNSGQDSRIKGYRKTLNQLSELSANPQMMQNKINENLRQLSLVAPETSSAIQSKSIDAINYLYSAAPKDPNSSPLNFNKKSEYIPSDAELDDFDDKVRTMEDPLSVLKDLSEKTLSPNSVEVLKMFYPDIYSQIMEQVIIKAQDKNSDLNYNQRLQVSQLFNISLEESLKTDLFQLLQSDFQEEDQTKPIDIKTDTNLPAPERVRFR